MRTEAGWFQDVAKPWVAYHWDGQRWTGDAYWGGRTRTSTSKPFEPPDSRRRIELDQLPRRFARLGPGVIPLVLGALVSLGLLPSVYQGIEDIQAGSLASEALPPGLVLAAACALAAVLYGIVVLAVVRARAR